MKLVAIGIGVGVALVALFLGGLEIAAYIAQSEGRNWFQ